MQNKLTLLTFSSSFQHKQFLDKSEQIFCFKNNSNAHIRSIFVTITVWNTLSSPLIQSFNLHLNLVKKLLIQPDTPPWIDLLWLFKLDQPSLLLRCEGNVYDLRLNEENQTLRVKENHLFPWTLCNKSMEMQQIV